MGTRSYVHVYEMPSLRGGSCVSSFYVSSDSYLEGLGLDMANWLRGRKLTNGWSCAKEYNDADYYNRAGQLVVGLVGALGKGVAEMVATDPSLKEEFTYHITYDEDADKFKIRVDSWYTEYNFECYAHEYEDKIKQMILEDN